MRKLHYVLILLAATILSCSKEGMNDNMTENARKGNNSASSSKIVINVYPGENDTQALIDAFAAAKASGKGSVVKLMPGNYEIGMIEVREFFGTLTGSGIGETVITNHATLTDDAVRQLNKIPALFTFIGGDVIVSDLSVNLTRMEWLNHDRLDFRMFLFSDYSADFEPAVKHITANVKRIELTGLVRIEDIKEGNLAQGVSCEPDMLDVGTPIRRCNCDISVNSSHFSTLSEALYMNLCKNGKFRFGTEGGNQFYYDNRAFYFRENYGVDARIENNEIQGEDWLDIGIEVRTGRYFSDQQPVYESSSGGLGKYMIRNNTFNLKQFETGLRLHDPWRYNHPENPSWADFVCDNNTFNGLTTNTCVGEYLGVKSASFMRNKINGTGYLEVQGMYWVSGDDPYYLLSCTEGCKFINNSFLQPGFRFDLDANTQNNLLQGIPVDVIVNDEGVNNRIVWR